MYKLAITTVYNAHKIHLHVTVRKYSITCLSLSKLADLNHLHTGAEQNTCKNVNILPSIVSYCHCDQTIATKWAVSSPLHDTFPTPILTVSPTPTGQSNINAAWHTTQGAYAAYRTHWWCKSTGQHSTAREHRSENGKWILHWAVCVCAAHNQNGSMLDRWTLRGTSRFFTPSPPSLATLWGECSPLAGTVADWHPCWLCLFVCLFVCPTEIPSHFQRWTIAWMDLLETLLRTEDNNITVNTSQTIFPFMPARNKITINDLDHVISISLLKVI